MTTCVEFVSDVRIVTYTIDEKDYYMATTNACCAYVIFKKTLSVSFLKNQFDGQPETFHCNNQKYILLFAVKCSSVNKM